MYSKICGRKEGRKEGASLRSLNESIRFGHQNGLMKMDFSFEGLDGFMIEQDLHLDLHLFFCVWKNFDMASKEDLTSSHSFLTSTNSILKLINSKASFVSGCQQFTVLLLSWKTQPCCDSCYESLHKSVHSSVQDPQTCFDRARYFEQSSSSFKPDIHFFFLSLLGQLFALDRYFEHDIPIKHSGVQDKRSSRLPWGKLHLVLVPLRSINMLNIG
jgi:hypothetical protein